MSEINTDKIDAIEIDTKNNTMGVQKLLLVKLGSVYHFSS